MIDWTLTLLIFLFPLAYSPGPGNMVFAANGARFGMLRTVPASAGYHAATWLVTLAIGYGFATGLSRLPSLMMGLQWAGAAWLLYLAWGFLRAGRVGVTPEARPLGAGGGVLLLVLNPKAYMIIALMFSQFLPGAPGGPVMSVIWITTLFTLNNLLAFTIWTAAGVRLARAFGREDQARRLNAGFGLALAGAALWLMLG
ncbi:Threonine/homoserine/homoserine lactone efflux protein [Roseovarius pacificus]|uniref:Threonine/homoserine/homoserine lactone efflux protein n=1 Tax=Roseovarius pacificus TaxID=337701 RepID=A0A1M7AXK0_9RHOB|nr:LysE family translocator [Roseovarius pacificus]GGO54451.1 protein AmbA [Roseovarius pacificus]SHL47444.1 Threonine/homoserine/homoserine lactone efflux protein [Roseovarius pacificus]